MFYEYFYKFCEQHGYSGDVGFDKNTKEYHIIISKDDNNAGAFLSKEELKEMNNLQIQNLTEMLHVGFVDMFNSNIN